MSDAEEILSKEERELKEKEEKEKEDIEQAGSKLLRLVRLS